MIRFKSRDNVQGWVLLRGSRSNHANCFLNAHMTQENCKNIFLISRSNKVKIRKISPLSVYGAVNVHHLLNWFLPKQVYYGIINIHWFCGHHIFWKVLPPSSCITHLGTLPIDIPLHKINDSTVCSTVINLCLIVLWRWLFKW